MAKIRDYVVTEYIATAATWTPDMPTHESGDLLIAFLAKDSTTGWSTSSGWTEYIDQATTAANVGCQAKRAASSSETFSVTLTTETGVVCILAIQDCYGTTLADALNLTPVVAGSDATTIPYAGITGQSTTQDNCLLLYAFGGDGGTSPTAYPPAVNLYCGDATNGSLGVAYSFQKTAGAIPEIKWYGRGNDDGRAMLAAVRSNGSGQRQIYSDPSISSSTMLRPAVGVSTMQSDSWPTSITILAQGQDFGANSVYVYESAPSWADDTTDANDPGTGDVTWCQHNTGDAMYFGHSSKFTSLSFITSQAGVAGVVVWEYWNGAWVTASGMSGAFTATGGAKVAFTSEKAPSDWVANDPGMGQTKYWVRCRITTSYTTVVIQSQIRLNGYVAAYIIATVCTDGGTNPYTDGAQNVGASSTANLAGFQWNFGAALDMDTGIIMGTFRSLLPRDFGVDIALPAKTPGGIQIAFFDANNNLLGYKLGAKGCKSLDINGRNVFAIDWNGSATPWSICGTIDKSAVTYSHWTTLGYYGAAAIQWSMLELMVRLGIAGGSSDYPLDLDDIVFCVNNCSGIFPFIKLTGSTATIYAPLQFGGGDPVYVDCNLNTFQFPTAYDGTDYFDWNVGADVAGIKFYPKSGDVLRFTNCVFTSPSSYRWEFSTFSSSGATVDFAGSTVVGANVTLDNEITLDGVVFSTCKAISAAGILTDCTFKSTVATSGALNVATAAAMSAVTSCLFQDNAFGIDLSNSSSDIYTFNSITFTGNTYDVLVRAATGTVTINVTNGDTPTYLSLGAAVTINNLKTLTLTDLVADSEVRIYTAGTSAELDGIENCLTEFEYSYNYVASTYVDIVVHHPEYIHYRVENYLLSENDSSLPIAQQFDRQYANP